MQVEFCKWSNEKTYLLATQKKLFGKFYKAYMLIHVCSIHVNTPVETTVKSLYIHMNVSEIDEFQVFKSNKEKDCLRYFKDY